MNSHCAAQLRILQRQYFQLVELHQLRWPEADMLKKPEVQSWLYTNLFDTELIKTPPPGRYQLRVLKILIAKLEKLMTDPEDDVCHPSLRMHPRLAFQSSYTQLRCFAHAPMSFRKKLVLGILANLSRCC